MTVAVKNPEMNATEITNKMGTISIADAVVAKIVGIAVREVPGVYALGDAGVAGQIAGLASRVTGADTRGSGVTVEVGQREIAADVKVTVHYGVNIPEVAEAARRNIGNRIKAMTGLTVKEVNLQVLDLYFADDEVQKEPTRRVE